MMQILFAAIIATVLIFGPARAQDMMIDGSSAEAYEQSVRAMAASLDEAEKPIFQRGFMNMIVTEYPPAAGAEGPGLMRFLPAAIEAGPETMHGRTLDEILQRGRSPKQVAGG